MNGEDLNDLIKKGYTFYIKCELVNGKFIHYVTKPLDVIVNNTILDYPVSKYNTSITDVVRIFNNIHKENYTLSYDSQPASTKDPGLFKPLNMPVVLNFNPETSNEYILLTGYFTEKCRMQCKRNNQIESIYDKFMRVKDEIVDKILKKKEEVTIENVFAEFKYYGNVFCSEFNPVWLIGFIRFLRSQNHEINSILDMSAGRASRLIACVSMGIEYFGTDPNDCVPYETMGNFYTYLKKSQKRCDVQISGFLEAKVSKQYDLAFTSPPYFDLEIYSEAEDDSVKKWNSLDLWLQNFMIPSMIKIGKHLRKGGIMAINIDNPIHQETNYVDPMLEAVIPGMEYIGVIYIKQRIPFSVWCWQKI